MAKTKNVGRAPTLKELPMEELRLRIVPALERVKNVAAALRMDVQNRRWTELVQDIEDLDTLLTRLHPYKAEIARRLAR